MPKIKLKNEEITQKIAGRVAQFPKYTTQLTLMLQKKPLKCVFEFTPVSVRRRGNASDRFQPWDWD